MIVRIKKWAVLFMVVLGTLFSTSMNAFAYTENAEQQTTEAETSEETEETAVLEENWSETDATSFSVPGNGELLDDISEDGSKQFLTIQTKNGNTFFLVLDRSSNTENVYMLSMIDENDLSEFISETKEPEAETPEVVLSEQETTPTDTESASEPEPETGGMNTGAILAIVLIAAGGIGGYYYFKVAKPKKEEEEADGEDLEFYDGGAYINEDQDSSDEEMDDSLEDEE